VELLLRIHQLLGHFCAEDVLHADEVGVLAVDDSRQNVLPFGLTKVDEFSVEFGVHWQLIEDDRLDALDPVAEEEVESEAALRY